MAIAKRHDISHLGIEANRAVDQVKTILDNLRTVDPRFIVDVLEAAYAQHIDGRYSSHEESNGTFEATMLLSGEIASDIIPHLKPLS